MKLGPTLAIGIAAALFSGPVFAQDQHSNMDGMQGMEKEKHRQMMPVHDKL